MNTLKTTDVGLPVSKLNGIFDGVTSKPTIFASPLGGIKYVVNITNDIDSPDTYDEVIALLSTATELDEIVFNINSYGGYVDTLNMILGWKELCPAKQTHVLLGNASSAATAFFLSRADQYIVGDRATFMIHEYQVGSSGTLSNSKRRTDHQNTENDKWVRETYKNFLTADEIEEVLKGVELYLDSSEIKERLESREKTVSDELAAKLNYKEDEQLDVSDWTVDELNEAMEILELDKQTITEELEKRNTV